MLPFSPLSHLQAGGNKTMPSWFYKYMYYPYEQVGHITETTNSCTVFERFWNPLCFFKFKAYFDS